MALDVELAEVRDFLAHVPPFDALPRGDLDKVVRQLTVRYFRRGTDIIAIGRDNHALYVVRSGAVDIFDDQGNLADRGDEGTCFGSITLVEGNPSTFDVTAIEDTLCLVLPERDFHALRAGHAEFARFFDNQRAARMRGANATWNLAPATEPILRTRVGDLLRHTPITAPVTATIREAAGTMTERSVSCLLLMDHDDGGSPRLAGILTDRDLRRRVVAAGADLDAPVSTVMTPDPVTGSADAMAFEALLEMSERAIHHLPVVRDGQPLGVITTTDFMRLQQANPVYLAADAAKQTTVAGVAGVAARIPRVIEALARQEASADDIGRIVTAAGDALERRLLTLAEEHLGPPPVPYCWVALGSRARLEQALGSDQDNALILSDDARPEHADYFRDLANFVVDGLVTCGYPRCPGDVMATNDRWRVSVGQWKAYVRQWLQAPTPEAVLQASIFFDMRPVHGDRGLYARVEKTVRKTAPGSARFLAILATEAVEHEPPLGFFRGLVLEGGQHADTLDIKKGGVAPVVKLARVYALRLGSTAVNTQARITAAADAGLLSAERAQDLRDAFEWVSYVRVRHQADLVRAGHEPDNYVDPRELSSFDQRHLREAFAVIRSAQSSLGSAGGLLP